MIETRPFRIAVPEARLEAIRRRVAAYDWDAVPELAEGGDPWSAGAGLAVMRALCAHWVDGFDWRAVEAAVNRFPQLMARIDGQAIHLLQERGSGPRHDEALVLIHGWPGSILEFLELVDRFAHPERFGGRAEDGIDVVVPALPGFGFSGRPAAPIGPRAFAGQLDRLLRQGLGYRRYVAQGGDWGAMVSAMLGLDHAVAEGGGCRAIHLNYLGSRAAGGPADEAEQAFEARCQPFVQDGRAYAETHRTRPQTLGYAMQDSPVGAAAWIIDKFHAWSDRRGPDGRERDVRDVFGADLLLANVMFYVATGSFATATWIYRAAAAEVMRTLPAGTRIAVPTGFASFPRELRPLPPRSLVARTYDLVRFTEFERGGHFAALERPDALASEVAAFLHELPPGR
ncbi:MAG: alpha/beta fold hydrolase [Dongiaceae bacterium]